MKKHIRCKSAGNKQLRRRIGNRHGKPCLDCHRQKDAVYIGSLRQAEGYIGKPAYGRQLFFPAVTDGFQGFQRRIGIGSYCCNQAIHNDIFLRKSAVNGPLQNFTDNVLLFLQAFGESRVG